MMGATKWAALAAMLLLPTIVHATGVRLAPDASAMLVNKDVGNERWAIALNTDVTSHAEGNLTGSVFRPGEEPLFFWCSAVDVDVRGGNVADATFSWNCYMQQGCSSDECAIGLSAWNDIGHVELPGRFFLP